MAKCAFPDANSRLIREEMMEAGQLVCTLNGQCSGILLLLLLLSSHSQLKSQSAVIVG